LYVGKRRFQEWSFSKVTGAGMSETEPHTFQATEWLEIAQEVSRNHGFGPLAQAAPEHWQKVLACLRDRMRLKGVTPPFGWCKEIAEQASRGQQ
jgi:hypothetical protein